MSVSAVHTTEFFDDFIDSGIYNSVFDEIDLPFIDLSVPSFDCLGEVNVKEIEVSESGYFYSKFAPKSVCGSWKSCVKGKRDPINLFGKSWDKGTCLFNYLDELFKLASMELMILDESAVIHCGSVAPESLEDTKKNYFQIRKYCIELCVFVNDFLSRLLSNQECHWALQEMVDRLAKRLKSLRKQLGKITDLPDYIYNYCAYSAGNRCEEAGYHVIHCRFDLRWLDIQLTATLQQAASQTTHSSLLLQHHTLPFFIELFDLAIARFTKIDKKDLINKSPFSCTCVQEIWIMLQILSESDSKNNGSEKGFWPYIEILILSFLKLRSSNLSDNVEVSLFNIDSSHFSPTVAYLFSIWFTYSVGKLYRFRNCEVISNYPLLENVMKHLLSNEISEQDLRICLNFVEKICLELWEPKTEPLLIIWEYFQRRLNQHFYIPGHDLDSVAILGKSAVSLLSQVKARLEDPHLVKNSFDQFLRIVGLHLCRCNGNQRHWNLMTGRIYSKLTPPKLLSLNQTGEHHFVSLFLTLALSADLQQVMTKFGELSEAYLRSKGSIGSELLKGQLALCLLSVERGESIARLVPPLTRFLATVDIDKNRELFSITIDAFSDILDFHHSLSLGQHLFIDSWIARYLTCCSQNDSGKLLDAMLSLVVRVKKNIDLDPNKEMEEIVERLWSQLGDYLNSSTSSSHVILADIAANLASIYLALSNSSRFSNIVALFSNNQSSDIRLVHRFITQILENNRIRDILTDFDQLIIETWLRSNIVSCEMDQSEMKSLISVITSLPEIKEICGSHRLNLCRSGEPLLEFFSAIQSKYQSVTTDSERMWLCRKVSSYLKDLDRWLKPPLSVCQSSQQISRIYLIVGNVFSLISPLLYIRSKPNSLIQSIISLMLLPISVHNAEVKIHSFILAAIRKTLHLFLQGLNHIGPASDPYIGRCVKELILVYIPRCLANTGPLPSQHNVSSFSLISLFNEFDLSLSRLILENVTISFFKPKARNPPPQSIHAIRYLKEVLLLHSTCENVILALSNHSIEHVCDIVMYCDNKTSFYIMSRDVLRLFFENILLKHSSDVSESVEGLLSRLCLSHLAWSSRQLFDLLSLICFFVPSLMRKFLPNLLQHIQLIETKRGVSLDKILRLGYERIKTKLTSK